MGSLGHSNFGSFSCAPDPLDRVCLPQRVPSSLISSPLQPFRVYVSTYFFFEIKQTLQVSFVLSSIVVELVPTWLVLSP